MVDLVQQLREGADKNTTSIESLRVMVRWGADEIERLQKGRVMDKNFAERLDDLIDAHLGSARGLRERYGEIIGTIEVKLMALKDEPPAGLSE